jgi:hypothetical protein
MGNRVWYEACALMANATSHHHVFFVASSKETEQRMRNHHPHAVMILVRRGFPWTKSKESGMPLWKPTLLLDLLLEVFLYTSLT